MKSVLLVLGVVICLPETLTAQAKTIPIPPTSLIYCNGHLQDLYCFLPTFVTSNPRNISGPFLSIPTPFGSKLNTLMGSELTLLPLASPASGITFSFDPRLGVMTRTTESFGPILVERSETIGRNKLFIGFTYQHFNFDRLDGKRLISDFPVSTKVNELKVDEFTTFLTYGITNRIDVSAAFPVRRIRMELSGQQCVFKLYNPFTGFPITNVPGSLDCTFEGAGRREASGLSDIVLRVKGRVWRAEHAGLALGVDLRTPTGDPLNYLGGGAAGLKPFGALSYAARTGRVYWSPHLNLGYEFNGSSILGGTLVGQEGRLPRRFQYAAGTEVGLFKRVTFSGDLIGEMLFNAEKNYTFNQDAQGNIVSATVVTNNADIKDASLGLKVNPWKNFLATGNLTFRLDRGGLRARLVPLVGLSYTF